MSEVLFMPTAIVPGSFDPMTLGHKNIIERAARLFDRVVVAIMINPDKKGCFSFAERKKIAELTLSDVGGVTVITADGYLADLAAALRASAIVKGIRSNKDLAYEQDMAAFNHERNPSCETVYLPAYGETTEISSTLARELLDADMPTEAVLDRRAAEYIAGLRNTSAGQKTTDCKLRENR